MNLYNAANLDFKQVEPSFTAELFALNRVLVPENRRARVIQWMSILKWRSPLAYLGPW